LAEPPAPQAAPPGVEPLIIVVSGPGGVGKGTIVNALVDRDPRLWLSRSWTTRARREGEPPSAYVFVSRDDFEQRVQTGGFIEWTQFLDNYYGTPTPEVPPGRDLVLEIEVDGAGQIKGRHADALLIFLLPPSRLEQQRRLLGRGDPEDKVGERLRKAEQEEPVGMALTDHVVVNDDLEQTIKEMLAIIESERSARQQRGEEDLPPYRSRDS
jgi:guanylate kinase